ncbi:MAG: hypothetical protein K0S21_2262 [Rhizobiaceae bacterium]|nr:hypothetical protein [Rhizobiaceae bacterium]
MDARRRHLMQGGLAAGLSLATGVGRAAAQPARAAPIIDIHAHVFNARDVPVVGFLQQVILRDAHAAPDPGLVSTATLKLLKFILLAGAPSPAEELAELVGAPPVSRRLETPLAEDERAVAAAIDRYRAELGRQTAGLATTRREEEELLDRIEAELGLPAGTPPEPGGLTPPGKDGEELAARIYTARPGEAAGFLRDSRLLQTIRWAGLLTRRRGDMLDRLVGLYGGEARTRVFVPALVDFERWFQASESVSAAEDQIAVMSALARRRADAVILNFAPFCPLRAALEREDGRDPLATLRWAVADMGFAGVKLYPPLGFAPTGNDDATLAGLPRAPAGGGAALDAELDAFYAWCVASDVPVTAHATNTQDAGICSALQASPARWRPVLQRHALRLNLAHFGGFGEEMGAAFCVDPEGVDWERHGARLMADAPGVHVDLSYWSEAALPGSLRRADVLEKLTALLVEFPVLRTRLLYGSDWTMIGREPRHEGYLEATMRALADAGLDEAGKAAVMGGNARSFLGLDGATMQRQRLARFFGQGHAFEALFPA